MLRVKSRPALPALPARQLRLASWMALAALSAGCGSSTPSGPSSTAPRITNVTPHAASTAGGATVTVSGANFSADATLSIGGTPATDVTVVDKVTLTAVVPAHAPGPADVVVSVNGVTASLPAGLVYVVNELPVIT